MKRNLFERSFLLRGLLSLFLLVAITSNVWGQVATAQAVDGKSYVIAAYNNGKYYALPHVTYAASDYQGEPVTLTEAGKVQASAGVPIWTLEMNPSVHTQFYVKYKTSSSTYYLYKNGTTNANYNIKGGVTDKNYWNFYKTGNAYNLIAVDRGSYNTYLNYYGNLNWRVHGTSATSSDSKYNTSIILLEVDEETLPPSSPKYDVHVDNSSVGGSISATPASAEAGTTVTLNATPYAGYVFDSWNVFDENSNEIDVTNNRFTMPAAEVWVWGTFKESTSPTGGNQYKLVTSTDDLVAGCKYVIASDAYRPTSVAPNYPKGCLMSTAVKSNNIGETSEISFSDYTIAIPDDALIMTLGGSEGAWTFSSVNYKGANGYLNATSTTSSNYLQIKSEWDKYANFTISFSGNAVEIKCTGKDSRNVMMHNTTNSCFSCYSSGQKAIYLYKEVSNTPVDPVISTTDKTIGVQDELDVTTMFSSSSAGGKTYSITKSPENAEYTFDTPTFSANTPGEYEVTLSQGATDTYNAASATAKITVTPKYLVTIETPENGTLVVKQGSDIVESGSLWADGTKFTIEATPNEGYKYKNWQYKNGEGSWVTKYTNYDYTIDGSDVSFRANFEVIPTYNIAWSVNDVVTGTTSITEGENISFVAPTQEFEGYEFRGWTETPIDGTQDEAPVMVTEATATGNKTYYAVYAKPDGTSISNSLTSISKYADGTYYIIDVYNDKYYAMSGAVDNKRIASLEVTGKVVLNADGSITLNSDLDDIQKYNIEKDGDNYILTAFDNTGIYLQQKGNDLGESLSYHSNNTDVPIYWDGFEEGQEGRFSLTANGENSKGNNTDNCLLLQTSTWDSGIQAQSPTLIFKGYAAVNRGAKTEKGQCYASGYMWFVPVNGSSEIGYSCYWTSYPRTLESITLDNPKTEYYVNDKFKTPKVTAHYSEEFIEDVVVTDKTTFTGYKMDVVGDYEVKATYEERGMSAETTYSISVLERPLITVSWNVDGDVTTEQVGKYLDVDFTAHKPVSIDGKVFVGWVDKPIAGTTEVRPDFITRATATRDITYYAVFANMTPSTEPNSISSYKDGTYYLVDTYKGDAEPRYYAVSGFNNQGHMMSLVDITDAVTINADGSITVNSADPSVTFDMVYDFEHKDEKYYLKQTDAVNSIIHKKESTELYLSNTTSKAIMLDWTNMVKHETANRFTLESTDDNRCLLGQIAASNSSEGLLPTMHVRSYSKSNRDVDNKSAAYTTGYMYFAPAATYSEYRTVIHDHSIWHDIAIVGDFPNQQWNTDDAIEDKRPLYLMTKVPGEDKFSGTIDASSWEDGTNYGFKLYNVENGTETYWGNGQSITFAEGPMVSFNEGYVGGVENEMHWRHNAIYPSYYVVAEWNTEHSYWHVDVYGIPAGDYLPGNWNNWLPYEQGVKFDGNGILVRSLEAETNYEFKLYNSDNCAWHKKSDEAQVDVITESVPDVPFVNSNEEINCKLTTAEAGDYIFIVDKINDIPYITVVYPSDLAVYKGTNTRSIISLSAWTTTQTESPNAIALTSSALKSWAEAAGQTNVVVLNKNENYTSSRFVLTDKNPVYVPCPFVANTAEFQRTNSKQWGTICLPFAVSSDDDIQYYQLASVTETEMTFAKVDDVEANQPAVYSIGESGGNISISLGNVSVAYTTENNPENNGITLVGVQSETVTLPAESNNYYYIANNKFWQPTTNAVNVGPQRAYFSVSENSPAKASSYAISVSDEDVTAIDALFGDNSEVAVEGYYNVEGVSRNGLQRGINIVKFSNGMFKKIIVK